MSFLAGFNEQDKILHKGNENSINRVQQEIHWGTFVFFKLFYFLLVWVVFSILFSFLKNENSDYKKGKKKRNTKKQCQVQVIHKIV